MAPTSALAHPVNAAVFGGTWVGHGREISILADGRFTLHRRTYKAFCRHNAPPCDYSIGNFIYAGDQARGRLISVSGSRAVGLVVHTTAPAYTPRGRITFTFDRRTDQIVAEGYPYCGPKAAPGSCGA